MLSQTNVHKIKGRLPFVSKLSEVPDETVQSLSHGHLQEGTLKGYEGFCDRFLSKFLEVKDRKEIKKEHLTDDAISKFILKYSEYAGYNVDAGKKMWASLQYILKSLDMVPMSLDNNQLWPLTIRAHSNMIKKQKENPKIPVSAGAFTEEAARAIIQYPYDFELPPKRFQKVAVVGTEKFYCYEMILTIT